MKGLIFNVKEDIIATFTEILINLLGNLKGKHFRKSFYFVKTLNFGFKMDKNWPT